MNLLGITLFLHVIMIATWFGGTALMAMVLRNATRTNNAENMSDTLAKVQRWNLTMMIPSSLIALATGVYMMIKYTSSSPDMPLWLSVKSQLGGIFIILFILFITLYGSRLLKVVKQGTEATKAVKRYIMVLNISLLIMAVLIFFVTTKIS